MKMYVDFDQYLLTASYLVAPVLLCYFLFVGVAKLLARMTRDRFRPPIFGHALCILAAIAIAPLVALFFIDRPAELRERNAVFVLIGAIASFIVVAMTEELFRYRNKAPQNDQA